MATQKINDMGSSAACNNSQIEQEEGLDNPTGENGLCDSGSKVKLGGIGAKGGRPLGTIKPPTDPITKLSAKLSSKLSNR